MDEKEIALDRKIQDRIIHMSNESDIAALEALSKSMSENQCFPRSHEFTDVVEKFGTNIVSDVVTLLKKIQSSKED